MFSYTTIIYSFVYIISINDRDSEGNFRNLIIDDQELNQDINNLNVKTDLARQKNAHKLQVQNLLHHELQVDMDFSQNFKMIKTRDEIQGGGIGLKFFHRDGLEYPLKINCQ